MRNDINGGVTQKGIENAVHDNDDDTENDASDYNVGGRYTFQLSLSNSSETIRDDFGNKLLNRHGIDSDLVHPKQIML